ncbi:hypothetical protein [Edaphocola aurantiacus]|uniref:hypothetical protein n=1 Tax=Edaphocola aurantiacus TaxID=2601682 RepID=UPI001C93A17D|nr:hypothetical protein [Edaphocola aurantiacus]
MQPFFYKLIVPENSDMDMLRREIKNGARFVIYAYNISLLGIMLHRISPAIFVPAGNKEKTLRTKYNLLCSLFGWWSIPGLTKTIANIRCNNKGGVDVTEDVMLNLSEADLHNGLVNLQETHMLYAEPDRDDLKAFKKVFQHYHSTHPNIKECIVGLCLTIEPEEAHKALAVGLVVNGSFDHNIDSIELDLYKQFFRHVAFEFVDLTESSENAVFLRKQGTQIF